MHFNNQGYMEHLHRHSSQDYHYRKGLQSTDFTGWQQQFRDTLIRLTGLDHISSGAGELALEPEIHESVNMDGYRREKGSIQTEPGIRIPFYLLLPEGAEQPLPLVISIHGHGKRGKETYVGRFASEEEKVNAIEGERDIALQAVREGYAVLVPDQRGFWEMSRQEEKDHPSAGNSCLDLQRKALMFGRTLIGERVHDTGRLIDYAATRSEIDMARIAVTGNSGGGTTTLFAAALDERITAAIPSSYFCTFSASVLAMYHCMCNVVPGIMHTAEIYDIAALIAPRPLLVVHGKEDSIFPIAATREAFAHVQEVYEHLGVSERCQLFEGDGGHRYYKEPVWPFVKEHL